MKDVPPPPNKKQSSDGDKSEERYEEPFEIQKARQDQARAVPEMDETAFYGTAGAIAKKLSAVTEADERALLVGLLVGCGSIIGRTAYYKVGSTKHFCNEFACFVGQTGKARKGTTTDFIEETLRLIDENWHSHCVAYGLSSGEGLIELVGDEIRKRVKVKPLKGVPPGPVKFEEQIIKEGVKDKRKLCLSPEFGEFLVVSTQRDGNTINFVVRNCFDGKRLEVNTKQQPQRATDAHISILANITRDELLKLVPFLPSTTGFCNRFLWCVIERKRRVPDGGPSPAECVPQEIDALRKIIRKVPPEKFEIKFSPEAKAVWEGDKDQENGIYDYLDRDGVPDIVTRGVAHVARLATLYALLDGSRVIELCHLNAALVVWRYCEICAIRLFGAEELEREAQLTLDYLRSKGSEGATRTEIWNRVFHNHRTGAEIHNWLCALKEKQLARYETEKNDNGNVIERWFATQCSGPSPDKPPQSSKKTQKKDKTKSSSAFRANPRGNEFARIRTNSQPLRIRQSAPRADSRTNSPNSQLPAHKNSEKSSSESAHPHCEATPVKDSADSQGLLHPFIAPKSRGFVYKNSKKSSWESVNLVHLSREAAPVKDSTGSKTETGPNFSCSTPANSANSLRIRTFMSRRKPKSLRFWLP